MEKMPLPKEGLIAITYKCNAKCHMCNTWQFPTKNNEEVQPEDLEKLPGGFKFVNITGGEPFLRKDIRDILDVMLPKTDRLIISTNGYFTDQIVETLSHYPEKVGVRVSLEGLPATNDALRGIENGFDHGLRTLLRLRRIGIEDIGFGCTVSDKNAKDMVELYELAEAMGLEFATAAMHNNYYFHKFDNEFDNTDMIIDQFQEVAERLLKTNRVKSWFRAWFNYGLANFVAGNDRLLPCEVGSDLFFMDPFGEVRPCNGMEATMGNIKTMDFDTIWNSQEAADIRKKVSCCKARCWMIGSVAPAMKKQISIPGRWVLKNKLRSLMGKPIDWCVERKK